MCLAKERVRDDVYYVVPFSFMGVGIRVHVGMHMCIVCI